MHNNALASLEGGAQFLVSASAAGIVAVDDKGIIRSCNPAAQRLLNRPASDLVGHPLGFPAMVNENREIDIMLPNGLVRTVEMRVSTTTWDDQPLYITALHDLNMPKEIDWEQHNMAISVIAHELNNPLTAIRITIDQYRRAEAGESALADIVDTQVRHMQTLVDKLRTATKIDFQQTGLPAEPVHVFELLLGRLHSLAEDAHNINLSCDPGLVVLANPTELTQMLDNYLTNALTHGRPPVHIRAVERNRWVTIEVRDQGPGVPKDFQPHLFERFQTTNQATGTGLGLWITRNLARAHGGDAWYEPAQPHGACFCLRLPTTNNP